MDHRPGSPEFPCLCGREAPACDGGGIQAFLNPLAELSPEHYQLAEWYRRHRASSAPPGHEDDAADLTQLWRDWLRLPAAATAGGDVPKSLLGPAPAAALGPAQVEAQNDWWRRRKAAGLPRLAPVPAAIRRRFRQLLYLPRVPLLHRLRPKVLQICAQGRPYEGHNVFLAQPELSLSQTVGPAAVRGAAGHMLLVTLRRHCQRLARDMLLDTMDQIRAGLASWRSDLPDWNEATANQRPLLPRILNRLLLDGRGWDPLGLVGWILEDLLECGFVQNDLPSGKGAEPPTGLPGLGRTWKTQLLELAENWSTRMQFMDPWDRSWLQMCICYMHPHVVYFLACLGSLSSKSGVRRLPIDPAAMKVTSSLVITHPLEAIAQGHQIMLQLAVASLRRGNNLLPAGARPYFHSTLTEAIRFFLATPGGKLKSVPDYLQADPVVARIGQQVILQVSVTVGERLLQMWEERFPDPRADASEDPGVRLWAPDALDMTTLANICAVVHGTPDFLQLAPAWMRPLFVETLIGIDPKVAHGQRYQVMAESILKMVAVEFRRDPKQVYPGYAALARIFDGDCPPGQSPQDCPRLRLLFSWVIPYEGYNPAFDELDFTCHGCFLKLPTLYPEIVRLGVKLQAAPHDAKLWRDGFVELLEPVIAGFMWMHFRLCSKDLRRQEVVGRLLNAHVLYWGCLMNPLRKILQMPSSLIPPGVLTGVQQALDFLDPVASNTLQQLQVFPSDKFMEILPAPDTSSRAPLVSGVPAEFGAEALRRRQTLRQALAEMQPRWEQACSTEGLSQARQAHMVLVKTLHPALQKRLQHDPMIADFGEEVPSSSAPAASAAAAASAAGGSAEDGDDHKDEEPNAKKKEKKKQRKGPQAQHPPPEEQAAELTMEGQQVLGPQEVDEAKLEEPGELEQKEQEESQEEKEELEPGAAPHQPQQQ